VAATQETIQKSRLQDGIQKRRRTFVSLAAVRRKVKSASEDNSWTLRHVFGQNQDRQRVT
jgi:hypothetical protein